MHSWKLFFAIFLNGWILSIGWVGSGRVCALNLHSRLVICFLVQLNYKFGMFRKIETLLCSMMEKVCPGFFSKRTKRLTAAYRDQWKWQHLKNWSSGRFVYFTRMLFCSLKNALQYSFAKCSPEKMRDKESIQNIVPQNLLILVNIPI